MLADLLSQHCHNPTYMPACDNAGLVSVSRIYLLGENGQFPCMKLNLIMFVTIWEDGQFPCWKLDIVILITGLIQHSCNPPLQLQ